MRRAMNAAESAGADAGLTWFKSSHSSGEGGACVEVAAGTGEVFVRDSKDRQGPRLAFGRAAWAEFVRFTARH
jgi:hypothetical protein